jgi:MFS family permease
MSAAGHAIVLGAGTFLMGAGVGLLVVPAQTLIQSETPLPMAGRVSSGVTSLISTAQILGLAFSATLAAAIGLRTLFFSSAALLAILAMLGGFSHARVLPPVADEATATGRLQSAA